MFEICTNRLVMIINIPDIEKKIVFFKIRFFTFFFKKTSFKGHPVQNGVGLQKSTQFFFKAKIVIELSAEKKSILY